jgi:capsular exopolysaccharide synthesis family protein
MSESVDAIRTLVLHTARADDLRVLLVTSAVAGEGKTSLASQLAASLARAWRKTLLIDGDLRNPAAHKLFELPSEPGFSEVLRGEVEAADAIKPTPLSRLWLMPAGNWDSHAVQALAQESVRSLFEQLKGQYDFIVVDSSPVLPVADTLLLGQHVDAALLSILRDVSRTPAVYAAQKRLNALGIRTLGAVVIGANEAGLVNYQYPNRPTTAPRS